MATTKSELQKQLNIVESYGKKFCIKFNPHQTELIIFNAYRLRSAHEILLDANQLEVQLDGKIIDTSTSIKYLGSIISDDLSNRPHLNKRIRAAQSSLARVDLLGFTSTKIGRKMKSTLYKVYIRTVLLYGCENMKLGKTDLARYKKKEGNTI